MTTEIGAGTKTQPTPGAENPGSDFLSSLSDDNKTLATQQGWNDSDAVFDGYRAMQGQLSSSVALPGEGAAPEQVSDFYGSVSQHWTPKDGYQFKMPDGLAESFPYDEAFAKEAGDWFQEAGLPSHVAQSLHDKWVGKMAAAHEQTTAAQAAEAAKTAEAASAAHDALVKEYGQPDSEGYKNLIEKAVRAQTALKDGGVNVADWFADKGLMSEADDKGNQQVLDPTAVKLLAFVHDKALTEDGLSQIGGEQGGNPFDKSKTDLAKQDELLRTNPERAKTLIKAAGRDPALFGL